MSMRTGKLFSGKGAAHASAIGWFYFITQRQYWRGGKLFRGDGRSISMPRGSIFFVNVAIYCNAGGAAHSPAGKRSISAQKKKSCLARNIFHGQRALHPLAKGQPISLPGRNLFPGMGATSSTAKKQPVPWQRSKPFPCQGTLFPRNGAIRLNAIWRYFLRRGISFQ